MRYSDAVCETVAVAAERALHAAARGDEMLAMLLSEQAWRAWLRMQRLSEEDERDAELFQRACHGIDALREARLLGKGWVRMPATQEEVRLIESIAAACKGFFHDPEGRDPAQIRQFCIELVRHGQCAVHSYVHEQSRFWLTLRREHNGWRHYLDERPVHCGVPLEVWVGGKWVMARYEAMGLGDRDVEPEGYLILDTIPASIIHTKHTEDVPVVRWPRRM